MSVNKDLPQLLQARRLTNPGACQFIALDLYYVILQFPPAIPRDQGCTVSDNFWIFDIDIFNSDGAR